MTRAIPAAITVCAAVAALAVYLVTGDWQVPLALCALAVASWAFSPSVLGDTEANHLEVRVDPAEVKAYRRRHPGTSISAAAHAVAHGRP